MNCAAYVVGRPDEEGFPWASTPWTAGVASSVMLRDANEADLNVTRSGVVEARTDDVREGRGVAVALMEDEHARILEHERKGNPDRVAVDRRCELCARSFGGLSLNDPGVRVRVGRLRVGVVVRSPPSSPETANDPPARMMEATSVPMVTCPARVP
jgi:hypothetical protein